MSIFTMINWETKELGEEKEFKDYIEAGKYCKENYGEGWVAQVKPFHFTSDLYKMLKEGTHESIKTDEKGRAIAIMGNDNECIHCGGITLNEWDMMKRAGIKSIQITSYEFVKLHNKLVSINA